METQNGGESITSTLAYALLSLLTRGPATGYQLTRRMQRPIGHYWVASHSQIYPELARLTTVGWVSSTEGTGPGPRAKKTYTLTPAGRAALREWLPQPPRIAPRSEMILKAYAANSADPSAMAAMYEQVAIEAAAQLAAFQNEEADLCARGYHDPAHPSFGNYATLLIGIGTYRAMHEWATWLAGRLREVGSGHDGTRPESADRA